MRVLIFSLAYHPFVGGAEVAIKEITDRIPDISAKGGPASGWEFDMVTVNLDGNQKAQEKMGNVLVHRVGNSKLSKYLFPWQGFKKAQELHLQKQYDAIWAMMANQAGLVALKFKKRFPHVKYLLTLQEGDSEFDIWIRTWFMRSVYKAIYRRADYIQSISNFLAERAKKLGAKCSIEVVPNGVKEELLVKGQELAMEPQVVTASRLVKKNGIEYLIRAMQLVDAKLIILGDGRLKNNLVKLRDKLNLNSKVVFKGEVSNDEVYQHLTKSSVFVRPSLSEGLGSAFLEAMAMGVPIIGTRVGGIPDFLKDGETGWFCEVKNPKSIAEKINYILGNTREVDVVADRARRIIIEKYDWNSISEKMKNIFQNL